MNIKQRLAKLEKIIRESDNRPTMMVFAVIDEEWQTGFKDQDFTGLAFEHYISFGKLPDLSRVRDLEDLKQITNKSMVDLIVFPVTTLEDVWAEERQELENESS